MRFHLNQRFASIFIAILFSQAEPTALVANDFTHPIGPVSTETLTAQKNASLNFTGVFIGMYATGNGQRSLAPADFDWFEYQSHDR